MAIVGLTSALMLALAPGAWGQSVPEKEEERQPSYEIDIENLLKSGRVNQGTLAGAVWSVSSDFGRRMIHVPLVFESPEGDPIGVGSSALDVEGGMFIAYQVFGGPDVVDEAEGESSADNPAADLPDGAPQLARDFTLHPNGEVSWQLERFIRNGNVSAGDNNLYSLKLDMQALQARSPGEPPDIRRNSGEDRRAFQMRQRQAYAQYREKRNEYIALRKEVLDLPSTFKMKRPRVIWATFDVREREEALAFAGADPLPWQVNFDLLNGIRSVVGQPLERPGLTDGESATLPDRVRAWLPMLQAKLRADPHRYTLRMASTAIADGGLIPYSRPGDPLYQMMQAIIESDDEVARRRLITALIQTLPPTSASASLVKLASQNLDPRLQIMSLRGLIQGDSGSPVGLQEVMNTTNRMLSDPSGPDVALVFDELLSQYGRREEPSPLLVNGVRFSTMPDDRRAQAVAFVVEHAPESRLANAWLNLRLLGAADVALVRETLEIMATADTGSPLLRPAVGSLMTWVFGPRDESASGAADSRPQLIEPITIDSPRHSLFRTLQSGDEQVQQLAWRVLPLFTIPSPEENIGEDQWQERSEVFDQLVDAALARSPTPVGVVEFLAQQPGDVQATRSLIRVVVRGSIGASRKASRALLGSGAPVANVLMEMAYGDRYGFGQRMYENLRGRVPLSAGLLRQRTTDSPAVDWFGVQISKGNLPEAGDWVNAYSTEDALLEMVGSADRQLAEAAVAAMVADAGGDEVVAREIAMALRSLEEKSLEAFRAEWIKQKSRLFMNRMQRLAGPYRMLMRRQDPDEDSNRVGAAEDVLVGVVELKVTGESISFGGQGMAISIPTDQFGIRIEKPSELKNLNHPELSSLPLESLSVAVDLDFQADRQIFRGAVSVGGDELTLTLQPIDEDG
ncbi:MAG: hypothetical protein R3336_03030 [Phycisphaeraceae bacterium]|nr:hypothetical protein [Phycisphaeraceae bacterium]